MLAILSLLGLGLFAGVLVGFGGDDDEGTTAEFGDDADGVVSSDLREAFDASYDILVAEGELSQEDADASLAAINFLPGPFDIDLGGGDDIAVGSNLADTIAGGAGEDDVSGRGGDDRIELGDGNDASGVDDRAALFPDDVRPFQLADAGTASEANIEAGDDTIFGGPGDDDIADGYGANRIVGNQGNDFLVGVDQDSGAPDTIEGGFGADAIFADEGDAVSPGEDRATDRVTVDITAGVDADYEPVTITDFDIARDVIELQGTATEFPNTNVDPVSVAEADGDTVISLGDIPVVRLVEVTGLDRSDILLFRS